MEFDERSNPAIGCANQVHRHLGPGLLESAYERCLAHELSRNGIASELPSVDSEAELLSAPDVEALARQLGLLRADRWVYLNYVCWGGSIDFVYGLGSQSGCPFGPIKEDRWAEVESAYTGLMEQFGLSPSVALQFEPFTRGFWGDN